MGGGGRGGGVMSVVGRAQQKQCLNKREDESRKASFGSGNLNYSLADNVLRGIGVKFK
jgi:hypothetical protein